MRNGAVGVGLVEFRAFAYQLASRWIYSFCQYWARILVKEAHRGPQRSSQIEL